MEPISALKKEGIQTSNWLAVGIEIFIQKELIRRKFCSKIIGWDLPNFIMMELPSVNGVYVDFSRSEIIVARYLFNGTAYGFKSTVIDLVKKPKPLLFVEFPETIEEVSLRKSPRYEVEILCKLAMRNGEGEVNGLMMNLSKGGCGVHISREKEFPEDLGIGEIVYISFLLPPKLEIERCTAYIKRIHRSDYIELGLEFDTVDQRNLDHLTQISNFLDNLP